MDLWLDGNGRVTTDKSGRQPDNPTGRASPQERGEDGIGAVDAGGRAGFCGAFRVIDPDVGIPCAPLRTRFVNLQLDIFRWRGGAFGGAVRVDGRLVKGVRRVTMTGIGLAKARLGRVYEGCHLSFQVRRIGRSRGLWRILAGTLCRRKICLARLPIRDLPIAEQVVRPVDPSAFNRFQDCRQAGAGYSLAGQFERVGHAPQSIGV